MRVRILKKTIFLFVFLLILPPVSAERLPLKTYTAADGLATSITHYITRDSQGFLWFAGRGGLSRFDGARFISYRFDETPNAPLVHLFSESRDRKYFWIVSDNGVYRGLRDEALEAKPVAETPRDGRRRLPAKKVANRGFWAMHETPRGELLFGSQDGLYVVENASADELSFRPLEFSRTAKAEKRESVRSFTDAPDGSLWISTDAGLVRRTPDGRFLTYEVPRVIRAGDEAYNVRCDAGGRIWVAFRSGVFALAPEPLAALAGLPDLTARALPIEEFTLGGSGTIRLPEKPGEMFKFSFETVAARAGLAVTASAWDIFQSSDKKIWIPSADGFYIIDGNNYRRLRDPSSMPGTSRPVVEDLRGNLWFGTFRGVVKLTRGGLTSYAADSGLADPDIHLIQETAAGELLVTHGNWLVSRLSEDGFETHSLNLAENARFSWTSFPVVQDATGALWSLQTAGLFRFPGKPAFDALVKQPPENIALPAEIFKGRYFYRAFNDRQGNVWFSANAFEPEERAILKYTPATGAWEDLSKAPGFPKKRIFASFAEDGKGTIYFGFYGSGGLFKYTDGRFTEIAVADNFPRGSALELLFDRKGRLWVASTEDGVGRLDDPSADKPEVVRYTETEGLASSNVRCLTEDLNGNIYAGTVRGVSRINAETGQISGITTADGLAADFVKAAFRDRRGVLWFGTSNGLSKYEPGAETTPQAPQVFVSDLQIAGVDYTVSEFGQTEIGNIEVSAAENNLQINFFSVAEAGAVRYQFKLEGAETPDWSAPTEQRAVNFANLPPGAYRFLVRAVAANGAASENPAVVAFAIRPPFWKTRWFLVLSGALVCLVLFVMYRFRTENLRRVNAALTEAKRVEEELSRARQERLKELERVRARIATDLHDDIGSSLTQIAVLSEVARNQAASFESETLSMPLERIKVVSRELVEAMSDVVWAINPQKDNLRDLVQRMRRFASDVCAGRNIHFELRAPSIETSVQLGANIRREVFAIFKEAVNNAVKYSDAAAIVADFRVEHETLVLEIRDDGRGFDTKKILSADFAPDMGGNGLVNIRRRAMDLGGTCRIESSPDDGTTVILETPLHLPENGFKPIAQSGGDGANGGAL